ncbi:MAG: EamA family transporter, partial [Actinomycetota bacterium]
MTPLPPSDIAAALAVVVIWGLNFVAGKLALAQLPPLLVTGIRFVGVAVVLAPLFRPRRDQLPGLVLLAALLGVGHFGLLFVGLDGLDAAAAAVLVQLGVPFSVLLAWVWFGDRPDNRRLA